MNTTGQTVRHQTESGGFREITEAAQASTEISLTAQGKVTFSVKDYEQTVAHAADRAITEFERLYTHFVGPCPWLQAEPSLEQTLQASIEYAEHAEAALDMVDRAVQTGHGKIKT